MNLVLPLTTGLSTHSSLGPYFSFVFVAMVGHAIIRHRLMDLRLFINRGLAYALAITITSATIILVGRLAFPTWEAQAVLIHPDIVIIGIVVLTLLSNPAQRLFSKVIDPY